MKTSLLIRFIVLLLPLSFAACGGGGEIDGREIVETRCMRCHNPARFIDPDKSRQDWAASVDRMVNSRRLQLTRAERRATVDHLMERQP